MTNPNQFNRFIGKESAKLFKDVNLVRLKEDIDVGENAYYRHYGGFSGTIPAGSVVSLNIPPDTEVNADYLRKQCWDQFLVYDERTESVFEIPHPSLVEPVLPAEKHDPQLEEVTAESDQDTVTKTEEEILV